MSDFTKKWRVKHGEPLNYNERIVNSACDIIEKLKAENKRFREEDGWKDMVHCQTNKIILLEERIKELETLLEQLIWIAEKADTDANEDTTIELAKQTLG